MGKSLEGPCFTQEERPVQPWSMQEYDVTVPDIALSFLHIGLDMILEELLVLPPHLGAHTGHDIGCVVFVQLPASLLPSGDVLGVRLSEENLGPFVDLDEELPSVTEDQYPHDICALPQDSQRIKCFVISVL
jgi:hypothetical protein